MHVRFADAGGLYLEVSPAGAKRWFLKFRNNGKEKRLALGGYPEVTLKAAREGREAARKVKAQGVDPALNRQAERLPSIPAVLVEAQLGHGNAGPLGSPCLRPSRIPGTAPPDDAGVGGRP